jgi:DNA-binding PadR family transcriptional regulator
MQDTINQVSTTFNNITQKEVTPIATIPTLGYALLSLLVRNPCSGYDIVRAMKKPIGFFWHARQSQIYTELLRLEKQGLIVHTLIEQQDRPDKKIYSLTPAGEAALRTWVTEPTPTDYARDTLVLKAYTIWLGDPHKAIELFRLQEARHHQQLAEYQAKLASIQNHYGPHISPATPAFGDYATLLRGISFEQHAANWCRWMVEQFEHYLNNYEDLKLDPTHLEE